MAASGWRQSRRGNFWRHVEDGDGVTVFETVEGTWRWVFDGEYDDEEYSSSHEAMRAAEAELELPGATCECAACRAAS